MIPRTDALNRSPDAARITRSGGSVKSSPTPDDAGISAVPIRRSGVDRSLGDALRIAQMSQNIIQRAMAISLQLKSIAANAIASGRVDTQALAETQSAMRSAFGEYGDRVAPPAQISVVQAGKAADIPDVSAELKSIRDIAADMQKGTYHRIDAIDTVVRELGDKLSASITSSDTVTALMRETGSAGTQESSIYPRALVSRIKSSIVTDPGNALSAQGNINYTAADRLMA